MEITKETVCRSCGNITSENFCGNCGQKKYKRIDRKYLIDEVQYTFLHTNKGFFYTLKNLIKNPGKTAREYIEGNRTKHYKPILLTFVLCGLSVLFTHYVIDMDALMKNYTSESNYIDYEGMKKITDFSTKWFSFIMLSLLPFLSLATYLSFRSWGQNYYEHVIRDEAEMQKIRLYIHNNPLQWELAEENRA